MAILINKFSEKGCPIIWKPVGKLSCIPNPLGTDIAGNPVRFPILPIGSYPERTDPLNSPSDGGAVDGFVGAIIAALSSSDGEVFSSSSVYGFLAIILAAVNIFGGFLVTQRMLAMYKKKKKDK